MARRRWIALDSWAYVKDDATRENVNSTANSMRAAWATTPGLRVRTFQRTVRAGGASIPVVCIVAQRPANPNHGSGT